MNPSQPRRLRHPGFLPGHRVEHPRALLVRIVLRRPRCGDDHHRRDDRQRLDPEHHRRPGILQPGPVGPRGLHAPCSRPSCWLMFGRLADHWGAMTVPDRRRDLPACPVLCRRRQRRNTHRGAAPAGHRRSHDAPHLVVDHQRRLPRQDRAIAFAVWGSTIGGTAALGPLLGGWLTTDFSWRWAFGINVPLGIAVRASVPGSSSVSQAKGRGGGPGVDIARCPAVGFGIGLIVFRPDRGSQLRLVDHPRGARLSGDWEVAVGTITSSFAFLLGAVLLVFALPGLRRNQAGKDRLLDLSLFSLPSFTNSNIAAIPPSRPATSVDCSACSSRLQNVLNYSRLPRTDPAGTGAGQFCRVRISAPLTQRRGPIFVWGWASWRRSSGGWDWADGLRRRISGRSAASSSSTDSAWDWPQRSDRRGLADVPGCERTGLGIQSTMRQLGSALGIAILGTILFTRIG